MTRYLSGPKGRIGGPYELFATGRSVWTFVKIVALRIRNRRAVTQLLAWDEHALKDIGLTRADVQLSLAVPFGDDPSARLAEWAMERRVARLTRGSENRPAVAPQLRLVGGRRRSSSASTSR